MGLILPVVGYVSGRGFDSENPNTLYNIKARAFVSRARDSIEKFYKYVKAQEKSDESLGDMVMQRKYMGPNVVFEKDKDKREILSDVLTRCTIVTTHPRDVCRDDSKSRTLEEVAVFRDLIKSGTPVFIAPGLEVPGFSNSFKMEKIGLYETGVKIFEIIKAEKYKKMTESYSLNDFVMEVIDYTLDVRWRDAESAKRL